MCLPSKLGGCCREWTLKLSQLEGAKSCLPSKLGGILYGEKSYSELGFAIALPVTASGQKSFSCLEKQEALCSSTRETKFVFL